MTYRAKDLPAWVRFRPKPKPLPVYTVPTVREWYLEGWARRSLDALADKAWQTLKIERAPQPYWNNRT